MNSITITQPDDWHLHVRDGDVLKDVMADTARCFGRAIIMPNLKPPVTTTQQALDYQQRIQTALPDNSPFQALMTLYLTDNTTPEEIAFAATELAAYMFQKRQSNMDSDRAIVSDDGLLLTPDGIPRHILFKLNAFKRRML